MADAPARLDRIQRLVAAARLLADPRRPEGQALRARLLETTGLSATGIELGLQRSLETNPSLDELHELLAATPQAPLSHVLLSSNVFVAPLRAIAIGLASSAHVCVRPSRREPTLTEALHALEPELFELVERLEPRAGEHVWAYGSDPTLAEVRASLPGGVWLHAHGHGVGAAVVEPAGVDFMATARAIALDTVLFDQQGCLSPRVVCVQGTPNQARQLAETLATELARLEREVPPGPRTAEENAAARSARDTARYAFETFDAGSGWVSLGEESHLTLAPAQRALHVVSTSSAVRALTSVARHLTCIGADIGESTALELRHAFPGARFCALGSMQRPPLDGPVDRRLDLGGERLEAS